jgi:aminobenzoyl-glutamate utilization protein B
VDLLTDPKLVERAWDYFRNVQTKDVKYQPLVSPEDQPAIWLNRKIMAEFREPMRKFYYDPARFDTYLDQLGIKYPTVRTPAPADAPAPAKP